MSSEKMEIRNLMLEAKIFIFKTITIPKKYFQPHLAIVSKHIINEHEKYRRSSLVKFLTCDKT